jgi:parallel beta-helix repeat protein
VFGYNRILGYADAAWDWGKKHLNTPFLRMNDPGALDGFRWGVLTPTVTSLTGRWEVGLTPAWWGGRFYNDADTIDVEPAAGWEYFLFFDQYDNLLPDSTYPFTLTHAGQVSATGTLNWSVRGLQVTAEAYSLTVSHPAAYYLAEQPVIPQIVATFDTRLADPNPPYFTSLRLFANGVPTNTVMYGETPYLEMGVYDDVALASMQVSWRPLADGDWQTAYTWSDGSQWRATLPDDLAAGDYSLRVIAVDTSGNKIAYTSTPGWRVVGSPQPQVSTFSADPTFGYDPLTVYFTATTPGQVMTYTWDFGDGSGASVVTPTHTYTFPGQYTVTLTVAGAGWSDTRVKPAYITVKPVQADFTASPLLGYAPLTVIFTDTSVGNILSSLWDFGDGFTSTLQHPTHTYTQAGIYTVTLRVAGASSQDTLIRDNYIRVVDSMRSGVLSADETWSGVVLLTGDVTVPAGVTLTISPNTTLLAVVNEDDQHSGEFLDRVELIVNGNLVALGAATTPIRFTSASASPAPGNWGQIKLEGETAVATLSGVTVEYATVGVAISQQAVVTVTDSTFSWASQDGLRVNGASPSILRNQFVHNAGNGLWLSISNALIQENEIEDNSTHGIQLEYMGAPDIFSNTVTNNGQDGIRNTLAWGARPHSVRGNLLADNGQYAFFNGGMADVDLTDNLWGTDDPAQIAALIYDFNDDPLLGLVAFDNAALQAEQHIRGTVVWSGVQVITSHVWIEPDATLIIQAGSQLRFAGYYGLFNQGILQVDGTAEQPVLFTTDASTPSPGDWGTIKFNFADPASYLSYTQVRYARYGVFLFSSVPAIRHTDIRYSLGSGVMGYMNAGAMLEDSVMENNGGHGVELLFSHPTIVRTLISHNTGSGVMVQYYASPLISYSTLSYNGGDGVTVNDGYGARPSVNDSNLYGNSGYAFRHGNAEAIDATRNYWGTSNPSLIAAAIYDYNDNPSLGVVDFSGYVTDEIIPSPTETPTPTPTETSTETPTSTPTETPTETPTPTPSETPTETPTPTPTETPTESPTPTPSETPTETPTLTPTETPTETPTSTLTETPTSTDTPTTTQTETPTETPTPTESPTSTPTETPSETPTPTPTEMPTVTPTAAATWIPSAWFYLPIILRGP